MPIFLIFAAVIMFACVLLNKISGKIGVPMLLAFILLGMFFGSDGVVKIQFEDFAIAEQICSVALIFIMFYGGFGTNWKEAKPVVVKAVILSSVGTVLTALFTGLFCFYVLRFEMLESFLIGAVISSTDAASVFSILRSKRLNLKYNTASLLEVESGSNDPFSYMLTAILIGIKKGSSDGVEILYSVFAQIVYAGLFAVVIAFLAYWILKKVTFATAGFDEIFVLAVAILSYAAPAAVGGNGYLSAYIVGIILGNVKIKNKKTLVPFFDGITGIMQMLIFFLLGLLASPSKIPEVALPALLIALFLTFVARPVAVFALLSPFKSKIRQQLIVSWSGLRGAASIVFAIMATMAIDTENDIYHIVFCIVLFSILFQGSLIPFFSRKLKMIDNNSNVLKTFTDYAEDTPIEFIVFTIPEGHSWCNKKVFQLRLPPETILALLQRDDEKIVPNGQTELKAEDMLVLGSRTPEKFSGFYLTEKTIEKGDKIIGQQLSELSIESDSLVIMIQREGHIIIPRGDTILEENDTLVINDSTLVI